MFNKIYRITNIHTGETIYTNVIARSQKAALRSNIIPGQIKMYKNKRINRACVSDRNGNIYAAFEM